MEIEVGDFIRARAMSIVCGIVVAKGSIPFGKKRIPGYSIRMASGRIDFIFENDAELISK